MNDRHAREGPSGSSAPQPMRARILRQVRGVAGVTVALLLVIWVGFSLLPEQTGVAFGIFYQAFFTAIVLLAAAFFWLLGRERVPHPTSPIGVLGSLLLVYLATVGFMVAVGVVFPQFEGSQVEADAPQTPAGRGKVLFWEPSPAGCFLCHTIDGAGGERAPDLTDVLSSAGDRVAGLSANEYLEAKIRAGMGYDYTVPEYSPIMPPFGSILTDEQISDVLAYLVGPR